MQNVQFKSYLPSLLATILVICAVGQVSSPLLLYHSDTATISKDPNGCHAPC